MTANPFIAQTWNPIEENLDGKFNGEPQPANLAYSASERMDGETGPAQQERRFLNRVGFLSSVFIVLVFSVFREVKHSRELFQMNQLVAVADAQRRQWQELARLDEAREAGLAAELLRLESLPRDRQIIKASNTLPKRRR